jgi:large repetitive protein
MTCDARPPRRRTPLALVAALLSAATFACLPAGTASAMPPGVRATVLSATITGHPAANTRSTSAAFSWRRTGAVRVRCRIDGRAWRKCSTSARYTALAAGMHRFAVRVYSGPRRSITRVFRWRIDRTAPTAPLAVSGGSLSWTAASRTLSASGATDGGSGLSGYQYHASTDGGATWSAATKGSPVTIATTGDRIVQFRSVDRAGNRSAWVPVVPDAASTVRVDRVDPIAPTVTGGSTAWQNVAQIDLTAGGSSDTGGSGFDRYDVQTSTDGGATWTPASPAAIASRTAEGETLARFSAVDGVGNRSTWVTARARIDRTAPTDPTVSGGVVVWSKAASATVTASGSTDSPGSGFGHYERETSTDGGATWTPGTGSSVTVTAQDETLVRFRAVDVSGFTSGWVEAPVRLDHTAPSAPIVSGGTTGWESVASATVTGAGSVDTGGSSLSGYQYRTSTDGGATWSPASAGASFTVTAQGRTIVQLRALDVAGNASPWVADDAKVDTTGPTVPTVTGGALAWQSGASLLITGAGSTDAGGSLLAGYEHRVSTDSGATWSPAGSGRSVTVSAEGETLVQVRSIDGAGNTSAWMPATATAGSTARLDRNAPTVPAVSGGSAAWQSAASVTVTASGSTDSGSGLAGYEYRTSTSSGATWGTASAGASVAVSTEGSTLVQFRSVDVTGAKSAWAPAAAVAGSTVKLDRSAPSLPTVSGGGAAWQNVASITLTAGGSTDSASGFAGYSYRTSTDGGSTWSAPVSGATATISAEGSTQVQFRSADNVGNTTGWLAATARIDRANPTLPAVSGGSASWQTSQVDVTAAGSSDSGSGLAGYQYQTSTDGGATWAAPVAGALAPIAAEGTTLVQFRSVDNAGYTSAWTASATVKIDTLAPTAPVLTGGGPAWSAAASVTVNAGGSVEAGSGLAGYRYQTSTNGALTWSASTTGTSVVISAAGDNWVRFQSWDAIGSTSPWTTTQVRLDRSAPTAPVVAGGSLSWLSISSTVLTASGSIDSGGSGLARYEYRTAVNGSAWSTTVTTGATATITAEAATVVQFRAVDGAGNVSAWSPAANGAGNTVKLDRTAPTLPSVSGGTASCLKKRTISASGSIDAVSGLLRYEYRVSSNNGTTWGATVSGSSVQLTITGRYLVQFRSVDNAGNLSAWAPGTAGSANTACIR